MKFCLIPTLILSSTFLHCAQLEEHAPNLGPIRVIPVDPTPEPDHVETHLSFPEDNALKNSEPVAIQMRLEGYPIGTDSQFPREKEIFNDPEGQSLHIFIDNRPYFSANEALIDALDDNEVYFDQTVDIDIPFKLEKGMHVIRVFPVRSFNESLKGDKCFAASIFYYKTKTDNLDVNLSKPFITYNEPQGDYDFHPSVPILLDFYVTNCQLSRDGYKVRLTIDGTTKRTLSQWVPYYIYGLQKGSHTIRLELLDRQNNLVPGLFNNIERTIKIR
jgi:hypothetical protein